ncbi:hypothetical protein LOD99_8054 [Oopsacas minuta]|uniref:Spt6 acidic N-terminal domain-containing protein n=1 Tax=Oopsacas minuta TaxID=111878 RepID=A0AAV7JJD6_9METZ|nr:hypothetical protein LOD99_8054 [Oopsacas minuta]
MDIQSGGGQDVFQVDRNTPSSSESDDEYSDRNVEDLINDDPESSASQNESEYVIGVKNKSKKRRGIDKRKTTEKRKDYVNLDDDDYDLLGENLGLPVWHRRKYRRVRVGSSGDEAENDIEKQLFPDEDHPTAQTNDAALEMDLEIHSSSEAEDVDDFIVDDEGQPISKHRYE